MSAFEKYLRQLFWILLCSFLGEALRILLPWSLPASIYGLVLLFVALAFHLIKPEQVKECGNFLTAMLPLLFVPPAVGLLTCWEEIAGYLLPLAAIVAISTVLVFGVTGITTQWALHKRGKDHE